MKFSKSIIGNVFYLSSSAFIGQAFTIITAPILSRIYLPYDYGVLGIFMVLSTLVSIFSMLQYQHVIIIEKDEDRARVAMNLCFNLVIIVCVVTMILTLVILPILKGNSGMDGNYWWLYFLPLAQFVSGFSTLYFTWANRKGDYKRISWIRLISTITTPVLSIVFGLFFLKGPHGLIVSLLVGQIATSLILFLKYRQSFRFDFLKNLNYQIDIFKKHKKFPLYSLPTEFLNSFSHNVPVFFVAKIAGPIAVGNFNFSNRLLGLPTQLISSSVGEVFRQKASEIGDNNHMLLKLFKDTLKKLSLLSILPFTFIVIFGPNIFVLLFGPNWEEAGRYTQILSIIFFLRFVISPVTYVIYIKGKQQYDLIGTLTFLLTTLILSATCLYLRTNIETFLLIYSLNFAWIYLLMLFINYKLIKS